VLLNEGRLRADLYYRLCVGRLLLPPLSARQDDIILLARYFIEKYNTTVSHHITGLSHQVAQQLCSLAWPGNVRMLENVVVRSMLQQEADGPLTVLAYDDEVFSPVPPGAATSRLEATEYAAIPSTGLDDAVEQFERQIIINALNIANGNVASAARQLRIPRTTLYYKVKKYHLTLCVNDI
jgi:arginine utilization regulatory protein